MLVANAPHLKREIVYVIGGKVTCTNSDCYDGMNSNDVWASSDAGETWAAVNARPPFGPRWGHGGWVNKDGVLIMWGGLNALNGLYGSTTTYREVWASFNGGYDWHLCPTPPNALFLRGEQGATVNANGQLIMVGGYAYAENGQPQVRYNDVWRTDFSVENTEALAQRCGGASVVIPPEGVGMRRWRGQPHRARRHADVLSADAPRALVAAHPARAAAHELRTDLHQPHRRLVGHDGPQLAAAVRGLADGRHRAAEQRERCIRIRRRWQDVGAHLRHRAPGPAGRQVQRVPRQLVPRY